MELVGWLAKVFRRRRRTTRPGRAAPPSREEIVERVRQAASAELAAEFEQLLESGRPLSEIRDYLDWRENRERKDR